MARRAARLRYVPEALMLAISAAATITAVLFIRGVRRENDIYLGHIRAQMVETELFLKRVRERQTLPGERT